MRSISNHHFHLFDYGNISKFCRSSYFVCSGYSEILYTMKLLQNYTIYQNSKGKMNTSTKSSNISFSKKAETRGLNYVKFLHSKGELSCIHWNMLQSLFKLVYWYKSNVIVEELRAVGPYYIRPLVQLRF